MIRTPWDDIFDSLPDSGPSHCYGPDLDVEDLLDLPCELSDFSGYPHEVENSDCFYCCFAGSYHCPLSALLGPMD